MNKDSAHQTLEIGYVGRTLLFINILCAFFYFSWWLAPGHMGDPILFSLLFAGEIYHVGMALIFWWTLWPSLKVNTAKKPLTYFPAVDIYIPVAGEPWEIIEKTVIASLQIDYPNKTVYVLNDGFVAKKENWQEVEDKVRQLGARCITRKIGGGAKAGNINHALKQTTGEFVTIFDADMVADPHFLQATMPEFVDPKIAFVQTPQYYKNYYENGVTNASWKQQEFFFGPVMTYKDQVNSAFICGTNVVIRRTAMEEVGGMCEKNIAEDFLTSLWIHQKGWKSVYLNQVLATGLAPHDLQAFTKQQFRWARGSLEVLFGENPLFKTGLTFRQKMQYLSSALFYFNGLVVLIDISIPLFFLFFGIQPVLATTTSFAIFFIPFMFLNLYTLFLVSKGNLTYDAISLSQSSCFLQTRAVLASLLRIKSGFVVTPKQKRAGNFAYLAIPHLLYVFIAVIAFFAAINRDGLTPSVVTNAAWVTFNIIMFLPFIRLALVNQVKTQPIPRVSVRIP